MQHLNFTKTHYSIVGLFTLSTLHYWTLKKLFIAENNAPVKIDLPLVCTFTTSGGEEKSVYSATTAS